MAETTEAVRERPILFSGEMVRAIIDGRKSQTRRVVRCLAPIWEVNDLNAGVNWPAFEDGNGDWFMLPCPYGNVGDRLWVRETWAKAGEVGDHTEYRADNHDPLGAKWRPSIHMPRWASRLTLEITEVCVERIQDISEADAVAEAPPMRPDSFPLPAFQVLWDSLNKSRGYGWDANPWVWVVGFRTLLSEQGPSSEGSA